MARSYLFLGLVKAGNSLFEFFVVQVQGGWQYGQDLAVNALLVKSASGAALCTIILMQIRNLAGRRSRTDSGLDRGLFTKLLILLGVPKGVAFSWALLYLPDVQRVLGTGPVPLYIYGLAWLHASLIFVIDYIRKRCRFHAPYSKT